MYEIICKCSKQILFRNLTLKEANEQVVYVTTKCDLYKKDELEIRKEKNE